MTRPACATDERLSEFAEQVTQFSEDIDPDNERCWLSLTVGWAVAKGMTGEDANDFATWVRYETELA